MSKSEQWTKRPGATVDFVQYKPSPSVASNTRLARRCGLGGASLAGLLLTASPLFAQSTPRCPAPPATLEDLRGLDLDVLMNVKVTTASKSSEAASDAPGMISVITSDELRRFGGTTLRQVLERVPGLTGATTYFTDRSLVTARGDLTKAHGGHILFLINGRPSREVLEGGIASDLLEAFPINILERIEVIKGPGSVLYGSNAFSAVVNLIVQKASRDGVTLSGSAGRNGAFGTSALATLTCGDLNVVGTATFHARPDWSTPYRYPSLNDPLALDASALSNATIRDRAPSAFVGVDYKGLSVISSLTQWESANFVRGQVGGSMWRREFADVGYTAKAARNWDMGVNGTYTRNTFDGTGRANIARASRELVLEWTNFVNPTSRDRLTFGALYNHIQGHEIFRGVTPSLTTSDGARHGGAVYAQLDHRLVESWKVIGGFQANKIGALDIAVVPRAGLIWSPDQRISVKALYGKAFRAPSINETRLNHPLLAGNPNLEPETVGTFDIGVMYRQDRVEAGVNFFRSRMANSISVDTSEARLKYVNHGEATFRGFELEGKYYLSRDLFLQGSALYQTNKDGDGKRNVAPSPNAGVKAGISYQSNGLTASIFSTYDGAVKGYAATVNPGPEAHHLANAYLRLNLSRFWTSKAAKGVALFINADNITNRQVWMPDWGGNTGDTIPVNRGRTIYFGIELAIGKSAP
ncbi:MAG: TonB-dependent receptor [Vicinamibacterales bacterium]